MKKISLRIIPCINSYIATFSLTLFLLLLCTPTSAEDLHLPNWQSTNAREPSSTSSYTYKFTTSSSGSTLSFDWSVSSEESYDFLTITLDGAQILKESGTKSSSYSKYLNDDNEHTLVCTYSKDGSVDNGDDCASVNNVVVKTMNNTSNPVVIPNNTIYYTSSDGNIVNPYKTDVFGANIISNNYENGIGIITFDGDVTSVGEYAFYDCRNLTSVTIPNSVTSIESCAFYFCINLTSITIPNLVTRIGNAAFSNCESLTTAEIPNSVTSIGSYCFQCCYNLTSVTNHSLIPQKLYENPFGTYGTLHVLPGCKEAYENAGYWKNFTIVEDAGLPNDTELPNNKIYYTSSNSKIVIPNNTDVLGANVVNNTYENGQGIITFDGDVTSIGDKAFLLCQELRSITIPNSVTSIGDSAFFETGLTSITIPNSVTSIGESAFFATNLTSITIPNSVTSIGDNAFGWCSGLTSIVVEASNKNYDSRSNCNAIIETATNTLIAGCQNTIIPNSVTSVGNYAFYRCSDLTSINIPNTVTSIGDYAFGGLESLTSITIPNSVKSIGKWAFVDCWDLTSITIPNSVTSIGENPFTNCNQLASISVENGNVYYDSRDNCNAIIETATNTLISGCRNTIIPNSVTSIGEEAFFGARFTSITVPNSVTSIGDFALGNTFLKSITIPSSVKSIGRHVFHASVGMVSITNLSTIPQSISSDALEEYSPGAVTLHVLPGCKDVYENAEFWNRLTIVEDAVDPFATIALVDGETYSEGTTQENKNINYTRTFNNTSWQALYIPFSMSYEDWKDDFDVSYINGIRQYDKNEDGVIEETVMDVIMIKNGSLIPNTPYLIRAKTVGEKSITINNATLFKTEDNSIDCSTTIARYTFTGTYTPIPASVLIENNYYAMGGGALVISSGSDLKPYRWYMQIDARSPLFDIKDAAKRITINLVNEDDVVSGITEYTNTQHSSSNSRIYDLNGRKVSKSALKAGVYIKNGKKVVIK